MLNVALVGVGGISEVHIPAWNRMAETKLVALCDIRPEQMEKYENVNKYTDFDEMLRNPKVIGIKNSSMPVQDIAPPSTPP